MQADPSVFKIFPELHVIHLSESATCIEQPSTGVRSVVQLFEVNFFPVLHLVQVSVVTLALFSIQSVIFIATHVLSSYFLKRLVHLEHLYYHLASDWYS